MSMGTTSRVVLSDEMQKAKGECQSFRSQVKSLAQELDSIINTLLSTGFQGEAADMELAVPEPLPEWETYTRTSHRL